MFRPKITITKLFVRSKQGHFRYYSPYFNPDVSRKKPKAVTLDLDPSPSTYQDISHIQTEKELCRFIYVNFGEGIYRLLGHLRGRRGTWTFWRGEITKDGFIFFKKEVGNRREINKLKRELIEAETEEEKQELREEIDLEKDISEYDSKYTKYGFVPHLKMSSRRGQMMFWGDEEIKEEKVDNEDIW